MPFQDIDIPGHRTADNPHDSNGALAMAPSPEKIEAKQATENSVFGSFWIDQTEFALPVSVIQEVVNAPSTYARVPLSPRHMPGLFSLRKRIIPVIDLRVLLGYPQKPDTENRKVAIIEYGTLCIGLLFDDTGGVINSTGTARVNFRANDEGVKDVIVQGVLKLENGRRLVQLLDPFELLKIERLPRVVKEKSDDIPKGAKGERRSCISFQLGHTNCAIDLRYVQEITEVPDLQKTLLAHGHFLGNIELRGHTIPIIDFRGLIGDEEPYEFPKGALKNRKLLILSLPMGQIGLLVYSIDSIMSFYERDVLPFADVALPRHDLVAGCLVSKAEEIVILLNHNRLMQDKLLVQAAQSCTEVYSAEEEAKQKAKAVCKSERHTYIVFSVNMPLAFDITCVSEIINRPEKLLQPPYALNFVDGILNLRGNLITLINPRTLYDLPAQDGSEAKVLIFHKGSKKYGMVVDSVDEIVTTTSKDLMPIPAISENGSGKMASADIKGCLPIPRGENHNEHALILDEGAIIARCAEVENIRENTKHIQVQRQS